MHWRSRKTGVNIRSAAKAVNEHGILLVYPINNQPEPHSLWSYFFPEVKMRWVWDESGDTRVVQIWDLRERLSRSQDVVYGKWYQNRATFFSREVFTALLEKKHKGAPQNATLSKEGHELYSIILNDSPQSTKALKKQMKSESRWDNKTHERAMKELWQNFLIVGCGEVDDGAFPSLNVGATELLYEDLWKEAQTEAPHRDSIFEQFLPPGSKWRKAYDRNTSPSLGTSAKKKKTTVTFEELQKPRKRR